MTLLERSFAVLFLLGAASAFAQTAVAADNDSGAWGEASDRVRCRLVAISPKTDGEAPDLTAAVESFATGDDVTFGVELQNVGDKPVTLLGVRLGKGYSDGVGELDTAYLGPRWFELEVTDSFGKPIARAARAFTDSGGSMLASTHRLTPGESLVVALRPAKFIQAMAYRLPAGDYQVRVHYHGPSEKERAHAEESWPDKELGHAWTGEAWSNRVAFAVTSGPQATAANELEWGEAKNGLRAAVEYRLSDAGSGALAEGGGIEVGATAETGLFVQNVGERPISFFARASPEQYVEMRGKGELEGSWGGENAYTGWVTYIAWTIQPGGVAEICTSKLKIVDRDPTEDEVSRMRDSVAVIKPGSYAARYTLQLGAVQIGQRMSEWSGRLETGKTPLVVVKALR